ncbi:hypothetical protein [Amycolatopsis anabasis]|uniref:hypothetical protein n=1 Tax=Amycolatopsis anabasis TaxID=1840409 RepID=UPI00131CBB05|nr:hypothetical protein [Amycolatopsis anabasis]
MSVQDRVAAMQAAMDGLVREQADRQALTDRKGEEIKAQSEEYMRKQVQAAERYVEHRRELGRRQKEAGGWATEKTLADKDHTIGFGFEDDDKPAEEFTGYAPPAYGDSPRTERAAPPPAPAAPPVPEQAETTQSTPAPPPRRGRHSRREDNFDEDDFSNNSWLD